MHACHLGCLLLSCLIHLSGLWKVTRQDVTACTWLVDCSLYFSLPDYQTSLLFLLTVFTLAQMTWLKSALFTVCPCIIQLSWHHKRYLFAPWQWLNFAEGGVRGRGNKSWTLEGDYESWKNAQEAEYLHSPALRAELVTSCIMVVYLRVLLLRSWSSDSPAFSLSIGAQWLNILLELSDRTAYILLITLNRDCTLIRGRVLPQMIIMEQYPRRIRKVSCTSFAPTVLFKCVQPKALDTFRH